MGFKKNWDVADIYSQIRAITSACTSPYNDGYTSMYAKKDLVDLKFFIEDQLERCPKFSDEQEWYQERFAKKLKQ